MRYKEFNPNRVLEKCIPLFWDKSFRGTAISDIVDLTGVNRFSLYEEFGNKEGILLAALELYKTRYSWSNVQILKQTGEVKDLLQKFYMSYLKSQQHEGCFVIHVGMELAEADKDVKQFLEGYMQTIEEHIQQLLLRDNTPEEASFYSRHLIGLFYTSMSFCLIQSDDYRVKHISNGINVILDKSISYA